MQYRLERDVLGEVRVPKDAYWGPETQRTLNNFDVSGVKVPLEVIYAYAMLKKAAAVANMKDGKLDRKIGVAITKACDEVLMHKLDDQFIIDIFQAGAGTCTNMNVNEVVANRAIEILGGRKGDYKKVNPNDHVNMSQSTNDTMPTTTHIATYVAVRDILIPSLRKLEKALDKKSRDFKKIVKIGRTHLQDAVPMTLGQEFSGYRWAVTNTIGMLSDAQNRLLEVPLGGTAVGTGINADEKYARYAVAELGRITGAKFRLPKSRFALMQQRLEELAVADALKEVAVGVNKIANDLRLLASGPRSSIGEITLPDVIPGSSIMPGKINPSMPEMMNMVCQAVIGNCTTVTEAAGGAQLEINVYTPVIVHNLIFSIRILSKGVEIFTERCVEGIKANKEVISGKLEMDLSLSTALSPYIGYAKASEIARKAFHENKSIKQVCIEMKILDRKTLDRVLDPQREAGN